MLDHTIHYFRCLDRGHTDCDPKWCCMDDMSPELSFVVTSLVSLACTNAYIAIGHCTVGRKNPGVYIYHKFQCKL